MTVDELIAFEEIKQLKGRYCYYIDYHEWDNYADLFTEDATLDTDTAVSTLGRDPKPQPQVKGRATIRSFIDTLLSDAATVHQVHSPIIELTSPATAKAIWAMEDVVEMPGFHLHARGHYRETYRKEADGRWRIASLHLTRTRIDMLDGNASGPESMRPGSSRE
jgi:ketosteroid isomerase-like protein